MNKTVKANAIWKGNMRVDVYTDEHQFIMDQPGNMGGKNEGPNPMEYLLFALGGCLGTVAAIIANQERIPLNGIKVAVEGDYDPDYLLGKTQEGKAGYTEIRVTAKIDAEMTDEEKEAFFERVHDRCPITSSVSLPTKIVFKTE